MGIRTVAFVILLSAATVGAQHDAYTPSDPARIGATGRPQLVEFYHPQCMGCQKMMPVVHGLARSFQGQIDFLYLNTGEAGTEAAKRTLGFVGTPQIFLLRADGRKFKEWLGLVPESELSAALKALSEE